MISELFLFAFYSLICAAFIFKSTFFLIPSFSKRSLAVLFMVKAVAGLKMGYLSSYFFSGDDSWFYFEMGKRLNEFAFQNPLQYFKLMIGLVDSTNINDYQHLLNWKNLPRFFDGETMIKLNSILHFISFNKYSVHSLLFSFIGFSGIVGFYKFFTSYFNKASEPLFFMLLFIPSLLFFTSGIIKESLLTGLAGIFVYSFYQAFINRKSKVAYLITGLIFLLLFLIKPYFIFLLSPVLVAFYFLHQQNAGKLKLLLTFIGVVAFQFLLLMSLDGNSKFTHIPKSVALKQQSAMKNAVFVKSKTFSKPPVVASTWRSITSNWNSSFLHSLLKPTFTSSPSFFKNFAALETWLIILMLVYTFIKIRGTSSRQFGFIIMCLMFLYLFYGFVGLTSATEGTLVRFKTPAIPFLLMAFYSIRALRRS